MKKRRTILQIYNYIDNVLQNSSPFKNLPSFTQFLLGKSIDRRTNVTFTDLYYLPLPQISCGNSSMTFLLIVFF